MTLRTFSNSVRLLRDVDAAQVAVALTAAADVALILDRDGVIRDLAVGAEDLGVDAAGQWLDKPWISTVAPESRPTVLAIMKRALAGGPTPWQRVNHASINGLDLPMRYSVLSAGQKGHLIAVGRDLREAVGLQQQLLQAQLAIARHSERLRHAEARYQLVTQRADEALLIVDANTLKVLDTNPAAADLQGSQVRCLVGRSILDGFSASSADAITAMATTACSVGRSEDVQLHSPDGQVEFLASADVMREARETLLLVRIASVAVRPMLTEVEHSRRQMLGVVDSGPDAVVVTDLEGRVHSANRAFLELAQLPNEASARGQSLEVWFGRAGIDLEILMSQLRARGAVRMFATTLRGAHGSKTDVEMCAVAFMADDNHCYGFTIRDIGPRIAPPVRMNSGLPKSADQLTALVGRVPLKELVRETTDMIERLCIETSLGLTGDNRAAAAEVLGLSRQSLYVKLRRFGLGDLDSSRGGN